MLHRKRKKPLAGARSFPAVRHEPTNPNDGLARAGAADRQGVPLLGGEQPACHSFIGEVEALNTTTIRRLTPSRRHQLLAIALLTAMFFLKRGSL